MLFLSNVTMHNIGQYDDITVPINTGLFAVCGKNGIGKTTLLRAIAYGLTGLVDGSWGTQQSLQKDGTIDAGYVQITLVADTAVYRVTRYTTSNPKYADKVDKLVDDKYEPCVTRRRSVDAFLSELYGINCQLLFQVCWGRQGQLDALLTAPAAYINAFLTSVFDLKYIEVLRDKLKACMSTIARFPSSCVDQLNEYTEALNALPDITELKEDLTARESVINSLSDELSVYDLSDPVFADPVMYDSEYARLTASVNRLSERVDALSSALDVVPAEPTQDEIDIAAKVDAIQAELDRCDSLYTEINNSYVSCIRELKDAREELKSLDVSYRDTLQQIQTDSEYCELCNSKVADITKYRDYKCKLLTKNFDTCESYTENYESVRSDLVNKISELDNTTQQLGSSLSVITTAVASLIKEKETASEAKAKVVAYSTYTETKLAYTNTSEALHIASNELSRLETKKPPADIQAKLSKLRDLTKERDDLVAYITTVDTNTQLYTKLVQTQTVEVNKYKINKEVLDSLTSLREALSQNHIQARYLQSKINEINVKLSYFIQLTDMPFSLRLNTDTHTFEYTTLEGFTHPAAHLSGAQKNIASVILQMSIYEVIQPQINIFLVDEPSESLDEENKHIMADLFARMNNLLPAIKGVMLIVSRDQQLIDNCENVLTIGG